VSEGVLKNAGVGREPLQKVEMVAKSEDRYAGSGRDMFYIVDEMKTQVRLVGRGRVERVNEKNIEGSCGGDGRVVGEGTRGQFGIRRDGRRSGRGGILIEGAKLLRSFAFRENEVLFREAVDRLAVPVAYDDVDDDKAGVDV
jgi:hypothetical protein